MTSGPSGWECAVTRANGDHEGAAAMETRRLAQAPGPRADTPLPPSHGTNLRDEEDEGRWVA